MMNESENTDVDVDDCVHDDLERLIATNKAMGIEEQQDEAEDEKEDDRNSVTRPNFKRFCIHLGICLVAIFLFIQLLNFIDFPEGLCMGIFFSLFTLFAIWFGWRLQSKRTNNNSTDNSLAVSKSVDRLFHGPKQPKITFLANIAFALAVLCISGLIVAILQEAPRNNIQIGLPEWILENWRPCYPGNFTFDFSWHVDADHEKNIDKRLPVEVETILNMNETTLEQRVLNSTAHLMTSDTFWFSGPQGVVDDSNGHILHSLDLESKIVTPYINIRSPTGLVAIGNGQICGVARQHQKSPNIEVFCNNFINNTFRFLDSLYARNMVHYELVVSSFTVEQDNNNKNDGQYLWLIMFRQPNTIYYSSDEQYLSREMYFKITQLDLLGRGRHSVDIQATRNECQKRNIDSNKKVPDWIPIFVFLVLSALSVMLLRMGINSGMTTLLVALLIAAQDFGTVVGISLLYTCWLFLVMVLSTFSWRQRLIWYIPSAFGTWFVIGVWPFFIIGVLLFYICKMARRALLNRARDCDVVITTLVSSVLTISFITQLGEWSQFLEYWEWWVGLLFGILLAGATLLFFPCCIPTSSNESLLWGLYPALLVLSFLCTPLVLLIVALLLNHEIGVVVGGILSVVSITFHLVVDTSFHSGLSILLGLGGGLFVVCHIVQREWRMQLDVRRWLHGRIRQESQEEERDASQ